MKETKNEIAKKVAEEEQIKIIEKEKAEKEEVEKKEQ